MLSLDSLDVDLRGYQEFGAKYLVHQKRTVLGDEMGLGKTIQALAAMTHLHNVEDANWFMVVCPASIIGNWSREIEKRSKFSARILHGAQRQDQLHRWMTSGGVAVTSFETLRAMIDQINMPIHLLIADEAHYLKNRATKRNANIRQLAQLSDRIALMTGTALENHPKEFAELVRICDHQLGSNLANAVTNSLGLPGMARRFETLVAPAYLRRNQTDVLRELPECIEIEEWITLSDPELRHYANQVHSRNAMAMRQAANGGAGGNAKLERLSELVDEYRDAGRKLVIFSFFRNTLDAIGDLLGAHHRIDGSVPAIRRSAIIDQFTNAKGFAAMVCQIEAGGVGINLQSASVVVLFEPQYKPTTEWQAIKRAHRMGQTNRVIVHRFLARETIDESLRQLVAKKAAIFDDYARNSAVKDASPAAVDTSETQITQQLVEMELRRIGAA
ncbi:DEAD/DEAH box helicase [Blastopirellula sediminis]|uniref:DEAD/DEAH box helicase n=1 Tax=Blastopirellula sediminis TaxID=2894196 RepID=UPI001E30CD63|nr:DEAD/DEAH box helicase [Blastopirellula sediminis]